MYGKGENVWGKFWGQLNYSPFCIHCITKYSTCYGPLLKHDFKLFTHLSKKENLPHSGDIRVNSESIGRKLKCTEITWFWNVEVATC